MDFVRAVGKAQGARTGVGIGEWKVVTHAATAVGQWIGHHGGQLVYGGGRTGLMGQVAEATRQAGGRVVGIIPQALVDREVANPLCDELHVVANMHQRKAMMAERSDAFLALPGGIGTLEELFEVWTWRQLGYHHKALGLLNVAGYYDGLLAFLREAVNDPQVLVIKQTIYRTGSDSELMDLLTEAVRRGNEILRKFQAANKS